MPEPTKLHKENERGNEHFTNVIEMGEFFLDLVKTTTAFVWSNMFWRERLFSDLGFANL